MTRGEINARNVIEAGKGLAACWLVREGRTSGRRAYRRVAREVTSCDRDLREAIRRHGPSVPFKAQPISCTAVTLNILQLGAYIKFRAFLERSKVLTCKARGVHLDWQYC